MVTAFNMAGLLRSRRLLWRRGLATVLSGYPT